MKGQYDFACRVTAWASVLSYLPACCVQYSVYGVVRVIGFWVLRVTMIAHELVLVKGDRPVPVKRACSWRMADVPDKISYARLDGSHQLMLTRQGKKTGRRRDLWIIGKGRDNWNQANSEQYTEALSMRDISCI